MPFSCFFVLQLSNLTTLPRLKLILTQSLLCLTYLKGRVGVCFGIIPSKVSKFLIAMKTAMAEWFWSAPISLISQLGLAIFQVVAYKCRTVVVAIGSKTLMNPCEITLIFCALVQALWITEFVPTGPKSRFRQLHRVHACGSL